MMSNKTTGKLTTFIRGGVPLFLVILLLFCLLLLRFSSHYPRDLWGFRIILSSHRLSWQRFWLDGSGASAQLSWLCF
jgi:hypothetical protein